MQEFSSPIGRLATWGGKPHGVTLPLLMLMALYIIPANLFYFLAPSGAVSSLAPGTILVCIVTTGLMALGIIAAPARIQAANYISFALAMTGVIIFHFVGAVLAGGGSEVARTLLSLPVMILMLAGGVAFAGLFRESGDALPKALAWMRWLLIAITLLAIADIHPFPGTWDKPVFPFSEPSHLALVLNPLLIHACVANRGASRILWIVGGLALAYAAESLTLVIGMLVATLICLPLSGIGSAFGIAVVVLPFIDLSYFTDRLDFGSTTKNLSSLIYRQGWELAGDALSRTYGWGVGFQQLGYAPFQSASADAVYSILQSDTNTRDGGFLLAKLVAEFGIIGALLIIAYVVIAVWAGLRARRVAQGRSPGLPHQVVLALCVVCGFSVDIFVRDVGYFASSVLLFIASLYTIWEMYSVKPDHALTPLPAS